jgi:sugar (pentulose or hexulose) kinase
MPEKINEYLVKTGQKPLDDKGQMVRMLLENLAAKYARTINQLEDVTGDSIDRLHIIGGGSQNELLNQLTADAIDRYVITGPVEATAIGNVLMQAKAAGQIETVAQARRLVCKSFSLREYQPSKPSPQKNNAK